MMRWQNWLAAWRASRSHAATGFVSQPEPRSIGLFARGKQLTTGNFLFAGQLIEAPGTLLWDVPATAPEFWVEAHGFGWLDDLAAVGDPIARARAQDWTWGWIARYGKGRGPGWIPGGCRAAVFADGTPAPTPRSVACRGGITRI